MSVFQIAILGKSLLLGRDFGLCARMVKEKGWLTQHSPSASPRLNGILEAMLDADPARRPTLHVAGMLLAELN